MLQWVERTNEMLRTAKRSSQSTAMKLLMTTAVQQQRLYETATDACTSESDRSDRW